MPALQRSSAPRGARFYEDDGELVFVNVLDATSRIGPRPATDEDREAYPDAWAVFEGTKEDPITAFAPMITFSDPPNLDKPQAVKAKGEKAPV